MKLQGQTGRAHSGPDFDNALRACLRSGVVLIDHQRNLAILTAEASEILGFPTESALEQPLEKLPNALVKIAREVLASGKPSSTQEFALDASDRKELIHVSALPTKASAGAAITVVTLHKIGASVEFLQRIRQLDRLANAGTLAAGMAHEIKNAMVAGRTFLDLLLEKNTDDELVQIVRRETGRIDAIVSRMLRFAATNAGALRPLHVHEVLEHALRLVQPQLTGRSVTSERMFQASADAINGDEFELHQAFVNLLLNAIEAMGSGGVLTVGTSAESGGKEIEIGIGDTGSGILAENMDRLFEPFFTTKEAGTGLGLAVTQRIIEEHGGFISVQSQPGQGTTFSITLPLIPQSSGTQLGGLATAMLGRKQD